MFVISKKMEYLTQLLETMCVSLEEISDRMLLLEKRVNQLGSSCKHAFDQTKFVVNKLADRQKDLNEDLCEYAGVIEASTFMDSS